LTIRISALVNGGGPQAAGGRGWKPYWHPFAAEGWRSQTKSAHSIVRLLVRSIREHLLLPARAPPFIECDQLHAGLAVSDIPTAIGFYVGKLGFRQAFTWGEPPTLARVNLGNVRIFLAKGTPSPSSQTGAVYFLVGDADRLYEFHRVTGVEIAQAIDDRPHGIRDYTVRDLYRYYLVFGHHLFNAGPALKIERVDVPVRLLGRIGKQPCTISRSSRKDTASITTAMPAIVSPGTDGRSSALTTPGVNKRTVAGECGLDGILRGGW